MVFIVDSKIVFEWPTLSFVMFKVSKWEYFYIFFLSIWKLDLSLRNSINFFSYILLYTPLAIFMKLLTYYSRIFSKKKLTIPVWKWFELLLPSPSWQGYFIFF
jgi:hypothetical protein